MLLQFGRPSIKVISMTMLMFCSNYKIHSYPSSFFSSSKLTFKSSYSSCSASSSSSNAPVTSFAQQINGPHSHHTSTVVRRSGNYKPTIWDFEFVQALNIQHDGAANGIRASELKTQLKMILENQQERVDQLEFIDDLQKLGLSYHYEDEIKQILTRIYEQRHFKNCYNVTDMGNLYTEALEFRLLRQHGFKVPQEVFDSFKNDNGELKSSLENDTQGLLQLYEASHLLIEGEDILEQLRESAIVLLHKYLDANHGNSNDHNQLAANVRSALELPLHWRVQRPNVRWFIKTYERRKDMNHVLLEFAKLDFNILQAIHQKELQLVSRWWKNTCLAEKLPFARDRLVECYFWTVGVLFEPQYTNFRIMSTKVNVLVTVIDDIYDIYGTMEELELFTDVIQSWDTETMDQLPHYMQLCFLALNNFVNEVAYDVLKDQSFLIIPYLRKSWKDLCGAYLKEAQWYSKSYTPTMAEYIELGWISISAPAFLTHAFFQLAKPIEKEVVECLYKYHDIVKWSGMILRLADDLATSSDEMQRGDVSKSVQCYMNETGTSQSDAEEYVRFMIRETWKKTNKDRIEEVPFAESFVRAAANLGRMAQYMYQHGDGHGHQENSQIKYRIESSLFESMSIP